MSSTVQLFAPLKNRRQRRSATQRRGPAQAASTRPGRVDALALVAPQVAAASVAGGRIDAAPSDLAPATLSGAQAVVLEMFGQAPIAFQRPYVDLTGSVTAALWLSHAIDRLGQQHGCDELRMSQDECTAATGLTRREQETARARLRSVGFIEEVRRGRQLAYRVCLHAIAERLLRQCEQRWAPLRQATGMTGR